MSLEYEPSSEPLHIVPGLTTTKTTTTAAAMRTTDMLVPLPTMMPTSENTTHYFTVGPNYYTVGPNYYTTGRNY